jgi:hypothetical protein
MFADYNVQYLLHKSAVMVHILILQNAVHNPILRLLHGPVIVKSFIRHCRRPSLCVIFRKMIVLCYAIILDFSSNVKLDDHPLSAVDLLSNIFAANLRVYRLHPQKAPCRDWRSSWNYFSSR